MTPHFAPSCETFPPGKPIRTRYAPDQQALAADLHIRDEDVLAVIDARGGSTYAASVDTGLTNRFPFVDASDRQKAVQRALKSGAVVRTPMGVFRRPPREDD
jgi:hypothetical protein